MTERVDESGALHDAQAMRKVRSRLSRAHGQLAAVIAAIDRGGDCREVVTQLSAVSSALDRAGFLIISTALRECIVDENEESADRSGQTLSAGGTPSKKLTVDELEKLFLSLA